MLVLGDAHAVEPKRRRALRSAYEASGATTALQLGDLMYYDLPVPTWFIAGNNEDLDVIEALRAGEHPPGTENANLLHSTTVDLEAVRFAGLGAAVVGGLGGVLVMFVVSRSPPVSHEG